MTADHRSRLARLARADQLHAAATDAGQRVTSLARGNGAYTPPAQNAWLTGHLNDLHTALRAGTADLCPHLGDSPTVVHAAVWKRWRLVCTDCTHTLAPEPDDEQLCDYCADHTDTLYTGAAAAGPLLLTFGLCPSCTHRTGLDVRAA